MTKDLLLPYFHPSTVVMVDDNQRFLTNFSLGIPDSIPLRTFHSAHQALTFLDDEQSEGRSFFSLLESRPGISTTFQMETSRIEQEISNVRRFREVSVVIVDYDMPEMDGLEFCRRITDPNITKILLTGVGDDKVAVQAFNAGLIQRFLTKNDPDIHQKVMSSIAELQRQYFHNLSVSLQRALQLKQHGFFHDPDFLSLFTRLCQEKNIVEHYFVESPDGFLMVSHEGQLYRLIVADAVAMEAQHFLARRLKAPASIVALLHQKKAIGWLWSSPDELDEDEGFDWDEVIFPAAPVGGQSHWHYALVENPPADIEYDSGEASFAAYLATLDGTTPRS